MLITQIREDLKNAMRAKDQVKLDTLRGCITAFTNELVAKGQKPTDILEEADAITVIKRLAKQRKDSAEQFEKGDRPDMAAKEKVELAILEAYLPQQASREDILKVATDLKAQLNVTDAAGAGKLMGAVIKSLGGNADGGVAKEVVQSLFS